ncbi:MAG TPA: glycosyltransferase family 4 protein, partial [Anaerolineae bacterium]|nr:glycosyltransferase family 4 protein [Anaerolineae bacterium]
MKIILLGGVLSFGGVEQHMLTLAQALQRLGHDAQIMGLCNAGGFEQLRGWTDPKAQVPVHWAEEWPLNSAGARQMLLDLAPDIVNVQLPVSPAAIPEPAEFAVVGTAHGVSSLQGRIPDCCSIIALDKRILPELRSFAGQSAIPVQAI